MSLPVKYAFVLFSCAVSFRASAQLEIEVVPDAKPSANPPEDISQPESTDHSIERGRQRDSLVFLNGNALVGSLERMDANGMIWRHPDAEAPIHFDTRNIKEVELKLDRVDSTTLDGLPLIECTNGDRYRGHITGLSQGMLGIISPAAGPLSLQAAMVKRIVPNAMSTSLYEGPDSAEGWVMHNLSGGVDEWVYQERALYAKGHNLVAVYTPENPPDQLTITLKLEWKGMLNFQLGYWGDDTKNPNQNASALALQSNYLRAYRNYKSVGRNNFMNQHIQQDLNDGVASLKLHLNRSTKQVVVFLDDTMLGQWQDTFDGEIPGDQVLLYTQGNSAVRVSEITLREWDGKLQSVAALGVGAHDGLTTTTGDEFVGKVLKIADGVVFFENEYAKFEVPLDRVGEITFNPETRVEPRSDKTHTKVTTTSEDVITLSIQKMEGRMLYGVSEIAGDLSLQLSYFSGLVFNPHDERHDEINWSW